MENINIPATEIDASITSQLPIVYKVYEVDRQKANYNDLRQQFSSDQTCHPHINEETQRGLRLDSHRPVATSLTTITATSSTTTASGSNENTSRQQHVEIRKLLQNSDWYKNLTSKFKVMVNQQLVHVSTELRKFNQDPTPNKIFDTQFILKNQYLLEILTNVGVFIDDNGEVVSVDGGCNDNSNNPTMQNNQDQHPSATAAAGIGAFMNYGNRHQQQQQQLQQQQQYDDVKSCITCNYKMQNVESFLEINNLKKKYEEMETTTQEEEFHRRKILLSIEEIKKEMKFF